MLYFGEHGRFTVLLFFIFHSIFLCLYLPRVTISHMSIPNPQTSDLGVNTEKYKLSGAIHLTKNIY